MNIDVRFLQSRNAELPIDVRFGAILTVFKLIHPSNVKLLTDVTADGIVIDVNDLHPLNALVPID